ncbi:hypothetical protein [Flavisphingomonas formosensis]|uniref:hypothetical protein n=1 Tax=Flavisphingomonas formosensis TaxID=861534 RepID=UPI0012FA9F4A|nr:hypothetical protein [Sphingomonas formosensis]
MQFLKTLFWVVLAVIAAVFSLKNWSPPTKIVLWGDLEAYTPLPVLLGITFLIGFLPPFILHRATRWQLRRRLETAERTLVETRAAPEPTLPAAPPEGAPLPSPVPPEMP